MYETSQACYGEQTLYAKVQCNLLDRSIPRGPGTGKENERLVRVFGVVEWIVEVVLEELRQRAANQLPYGTECVLYVKRSSIV
jgi:hypothetical protein